MASRIVADRLLTGEMPYPPSPHLWDALLPADRERLLRRPSHRELPPSSGPERFVADIMAERRQAMRLRVLRDAGSLVAMALTGAAVAVYVAPTVSWDLAGATAAWFLALTLLVRHAARRARGRGVGGTPEENALYHADPERFALGGVYSFSLGAGLGMAAMLAALVASIPR